MPWRQGGCYVNRIKGVALERIVARRHDAQVNITVVEVALEASGGRLQQVNLDVGVTALVLRDERSEKVLNHLRGSAHAQRSGIASFERVRSFPKRCRVFQESATAPQKVFTFRR